MKVLFDTNIILDVLLNRSEFVELSTNIISLVETKKIEGYLCATTITTLDYLITKAKNRATANTEIKKILNLFAISEVNTQVINLALNSSFKDFEDAVLYFSGECIGIDAVVSRNIKDFKCATRPIYSPTELWHVNLKRNNE